MTDHDNDLLVIGSGFGGSVTALRLSEKGHRVGVLEAGRRIRDQDKGHADLHPPLGSPYVRVDAVAPAQPAVPSSAPGALQFSGQDASGR
jgi:choline dehydrogenase-like flavoprotein